jgi:DNA primase
VTNYKYFLSRGISEKTQEEFGAKYCTSGKMAGRVVFPIYDENKEIISFAGRSVFDNNNVKWKILGPKTEALYPIHLNIEHIKEKGEVILVEGISDVVKLWDEGIKNVICLFGTALTAKLKSFLVCLNLKSIIIATNNEPDNEFIGNMAAEKVYNSLARFYPKDKIKVKLPTKKDFGEMTSQEISKWENS